MGEDHSKINQRLKLWDCIQRDPSLCHATAV